MDSPQGNSPQELGIIAPDASETDAHADDFEPGEWDSLLSDGEQSGLALDGESVFAELRNLRYRQSNPDTE
jgi:hypothetical protein